MYPNQITPCDQPLENLSVFTVFLVSYVTTVVGLNRRMVVVVTIITSLLRTACNHMLIY